MWLILARYINNGRLWNQIISGLWIVQKQEHLKSIWTWVLNQEVNDQILRIKIFVIIISSSKKKSQKKLVLK